MSANRGSRTPISTTKGAPTVIGERSMTVRARAASVYHLGGFVVTDADLKQTRAL